MIRPRAILVVAVLLTCGTAAASGSFSIVFTPLELTLEANLEQQIAVIEGWTILAGTGLGVSPDGITKLQPYTLACRWWDVILAGAEVCAEARAPIVGASDVLRVFVSIAW